MLHRIPLWFQQMFSGYTWQMDTSNKELYLTFDDGPIPNVTDWVLAQLEEFGVKATFFVVGENVQRHPSIFERIINNGHTVGNHTFYHSKGWRTNKKLYLEGVEKCSRIIEKYQKSSTALFRPPHGQITPTQASLLRKNYQLVMWSTLTMDYDRGLGKEICLKKSIKATKKGSIIVFHDSVKAEKNLTYVLPKYIEHFLNLGYTFKAL